MTRFKIGLVVLATSISVNSLGLASSIRQASQTATITGTVTDPSGAVISEAVIEVLVGGQVVSTTTTGQDGGYRVTVTPEAQQQLRIRRDGFATETIDIDSGSGDMTRDLTLRVARVANEIVVTASRTDQTLATVSESIAVLTREDVEALSSRSLGDIVNTVAGLNVEATGREGALASLFSRGAESDYNLVLVDGVRVNSNGGQFDFSRIAGSEVERVEVVRGAQSALYGSDAIGSVVHVFTKRASPTDTPRITGSVEGGTFKTGRGDAQVAGGVGQRFDYQLGASYRSTDGAFSDMLPEKDRYDQIAFDAGVGVLLGDRATLRTDWRYSNARGRSVGQIVYGARDTGTRANTRTLSWSVRYTQRVNAHFDHLATFAFFDEERESEDLVADPPFSVFAVLEGEPGAIFPHSPRLVRLIDEASFDAIAAGNQTIPQSQFLASTPFGVSDFPFSSTTKFRRPAAKYQANLRWGGSQLLSGGYEFERESDILNKHFRITNNAYFIQQRFDLDQRWFLTFGGRVDDNSRFGMHFSPKASVGAYLLPFTSGPVSSIKAFFNIGKGIKNPTFGELFGSAFSDGNPDLDPERARTLDTGVELTFSDQRWLGRLTFFDNQYEDQVAFRSTGSGVDGRPDFINVNGSEARGWEFEMALQRPLAGFTANGWYAYVDTGVTATASTSQQFQPGQPLLRRPKHAAMARVRYQRGRATLNFDMRYVGERHDSSFLFMSTLAGRPVDITVNPGYTLVGAGVDFLIAEETTLFVRGDNLGDTTYESALGFPGLPRSVNAGVRFRSPLLR